MCKKFIMENGDIITRVSRWIKIESAYNVTKKHSLWDYVTDENGYLSCQDNFDPENGTFLDYFKHNGRKYAIDQFVRLGGICGGTPIYFKDTRPGGGLPFFPAGDIQNRPGKAIFM